MDDVGRRAACCGTDPPPPAEGASDRLKERSHRTVNPCWGRWISYPSLSATLSTPLHWALQSKLDVKMFKSDLTESRSSMNKQQHNSQDGARIAKPSVRAPCRSCRSPLPFPHPSHRQRRWKKGVYCRVGGGERSGKRKVTRVVLYVPKVIFFGERIK